MSWSPFSKTEIKQTGMPVIQVGIGGDIIIIGKKHTDYIQNGYQYNVNVYSIINLITRAAAGVEWEAQTKVGEEWQPDPDSWLADLIEQPNPNQGFKEVVEEILGFKLITANGYLHGVKGMEESQLSEIWNLPPQQVEILSEGGVESEIIGYKLSGAKGQTIEAQNVMHTKYWNPDYSSKGSHLYGMSPIMAARLTLTQNNDSYKAQSRSFKNMGAEGILTYAGDTPPSNVKSVVDNLRKQIEERSTGIENYKKMLVNTGKWKWEQFGMSPADLKVLASQKASMRDLCNIYGVNSALLNDPDNKTYNNMGEARKALYSDVLIPELNSFVNQFNQWIGSGDNGVRLAYNTDHIDVLQEDMEKQAKWLAKATWLTDDEKREAMGYPALEAGDEA